MRALAMATRGLVASDANKRGCRPLAEVANRGTEHHSHAALSHHELVAVCNRIAASAVVSSGMIRGLQGVSV